MKKIIIGCAIISVMLSGCWRPPYGGGYDGGRHGGGMDRHDDGEGRH